MFVPADTFHREVDAVGFSIGSEIETKPKRRWIHATFSWLFGSLSWMFPCYKDMQSEVIEKDTVLIYLPNVERASVEICRTLSESTSATKGTVIPLEVLAMHPAFTKSGNKIKCYYINYPTAATTQEPPSGSPLALLSLTIDDLEEEHLPCGPARTAVEACEMVVGQLQRERRVIVGGESRAKVWVYYLSCIRL